MERQKLEMDDPVFAPGETKRARGVVKVLPVGLNCKAEIWLGPDASIKTVSGGITTFLSSGLNQVVDQSIIMPAVEGSYKVFVDVYVMDILMAAYVATEDVIIPSASVSQVLWL